MQKTAVIYAENIISMSTRININVIMEQIYTLYMETDSLKSLAEQLCYKKINSESPGRNRCGQWMKFYITDWTVLLHYKV